MGYIIKNAHIIDPANGRDGPGDIIINEEIIGAQSADSSDYTLINAGGLYCVPGLVDMHVHFRDPGQTHKEDIGSGSRAAARGGVTSVLCMPNTLPAVSDAKTLDYITSKADLESLINIYQAASITKGLLGREICDFSVLSEHGAAAVTDDGRPVESCEIMEKALIAANESGLPVISHSEDLTLSNDGIMNDGEISRKLGVKGIPKSAEENAIAREIDIAEKLRLPIHIAHVSTAGSCQIIREAKKRGVKVSAETAPHYFALTHDCLISKNANFRMNPPLREKSDTQAIIKALCDGTLDAIATDHAPHTPSEKADFMKAPNGILGLETSFAVSFSILVLTGLLNFSQLIRLMSLNPARILKINAGTLSAGARADITLFDPSVKYKFNVCESASKSRNTPFDGIELTGMVVTTFCGGKPVFDRKFNLEV